MVAVVFEGRSIDRERYNDELIGRRRKHGKSGEALREMGRKCGGEGPKVGALLLSG